MSFSSFSNLPKSWMSLLGQCAFARLFQKCITVRNKIVFPKLSMLLFGNCWRKTTLAISPKDHLMLLELANISPW